MAKTLQDQFVASSSAENSAALGELYNTAFTNAMGEVSKTREEDLAQYRQPELMANSKLARLEAENKIRTAPERFEIEDINRFKQKRVANLTKLIGVLDDPAIPDEDKQELIGMHLDTYRKQDMERAVPQQKGGKTLSTAFDPAVDFRRTSIDQKFENIRQMAMGNPTKFRELLQKSLEAYSSDEKSIITEKAKREDVVGDAVKKSFEYRPWPPQAGGSGSANEIKVLEHYRKGLNDTIVAMDRDLRADARADQIGIIIDSAGRVSTTQDLSQRPRDRAIYEQIKRNIEAKHGARRDAAIKMLEQIRKQYNLPYDQSVLTPGQQPQQAKAQQRVRMERGPDGKLRPVQ